MRDYTSDVRDPGDIPGTRWSRCAGSSAAVHACQVERVPPFRERGTDRGGSEKSGGEEEQRQKVIVEIVQCSFVEVRFELQERKLIVVVQLLTFSVEFTLCRKLINKDGCAGKF